MVSRLVSAASGRVLPQAVVAMAAMCWHTGVFAQSECEPNPFTLAGDVRQWETASGIVVPDAVETQLAQQFCDAAFRVIGAHTYLSPARMEELQPYAVEEYLNGQIGADSGPSFAAILSGALSISGFSRPVGKRYGVLEVEYQAEVDAVAVDGESMPPAERILLPVGGIELSGQRNGQPVCEASVEISGGQVATAQC